MRDLDDIRAWDWEVPEELIASAPSAQRAESRLLVVDPSADTLSEARFSEIGALLRRGDLLVVNDVRVVPARIRCARATGGAVEVLVLGLGDEGCWAPGPASMVAMFGSNRPVRDGDALFVRGAGDGREAVFRVVERLPGGIARIEPEGDAAQEPLLALLERLGSLPLPPYIEAARVRQAAAGRDPGLARAADAERYQTVFASRPGAVAAPTAGLHFDRALLGALDGAGVPAAAVTLHVGAGTFRPVRSERLSEHAMHLEHYVVPESTAAAIRACRAAGGRVVAVGTTSLRTLEAAAATEGGVACGPGATDLFVRPGYSFRVVDALITNFHLPRSTLLPLVAAFGGYERLRAAYRHAVRERFRFFSYGDAMFLPCRAGASP